MSVDKWLEKALISLERGDWYDSLESFQGALFRAIKQKNFEEAQELFRRAISEFEKHSLFKEIEKIASYFLQLATKIGREPQAIATVFEAGRTLMEHGTYLPAIGTLRLVAQRSEGGVEDIQEAIAISFEKLAETTDSKQEEVMFKEQGALNYILAKNVKKGRQIFGKLAERGEIKHSCYAIMAALIDGDTTEGKGILEGLGKVKGFIGKRRLGKDPYYAFAERAKDTYIKQDTATFLTMFDEYRQLFAQDKILERLARILSKQFPRMEPTGFPGFPGMPFGGGV
ncbi:MAG: hypothetical protein ACE5R6_08950 [Candidatus Heimdallarchaeota archaeon]